MKKKENKSILFFGFFVLPFLAGVVLLFIGFNSLRNLKTYYPLGVEINQETKEMDSVYHVVPDLAFWDLNGDSIIYSFQEKPVLVINFTLGDLPYARKQMSYADHLTERHSGINILIMFQGRNFKEFLIEDDLKLFERNERMSVVGYDKSNSEIVSKAFYPNGYTNEEYTLVDIEGHIRSQFNIEDTRFVKKHALQILKLLDKENFKYREEIKQIRE